MYFEHQYFPCLLANHDGTLVIRFLYTLRIITVKFQVLDFLSLRKNDIKMVKNVFRNLSGVSNMEDQGRVTLKTLVSANSQYIIYASVGEIELLSKAGFACFHETLHKFCLILV